MGYVGDDVFGLDEILGADEILGGYVGDDGLGLFSGDELMGADAHRPHHRGHHPAAKSLAHRVAMARAAGGAFVQSNNNKRGAYEQVLPFPATTVLTLASADIVLTPQRTFRTERMVVSSAIAQYFVITNIVIGQDPQFVATGQVPATMFSEVGVGVRLKGSTANLGNTIVVSVTSIDTTAASQVFRGGIIGTCVY